MILPGTRKVQLDTILVPKGSIAARKKAPQHESRKASIKRHGLINLIVIQDRTRKLLAGGDRLAALLALKVKTHEVRVFRGTEEEFEALQLAENIERRHNDDVDALTKRYVELTTGEIEKAEATEHVHDFVAVEDDGDGATHACACGATRIAGPTVSAVKPPEAAPAPVGRPKTAKGKAREAVAAATGKTPEAIRQAEKRANAKEKKAAEPAPPPTDPTVPPVDTYALPLLSDDDAFQVIEAQDALKKVEALLRKAHAVLMNDVEPNGLAAVICNTVKATLYGFAEDVREAIPVAVCGTCKRLPGRVENCQDCSRTGFIGAEQALSLADGLRLGGDDAVVLNNRGSFVPYAREAEKAAAKKLRIEMPDGSTLKGGE